MTTSSARSHEAMPRPSSTWRELRALEGRFGALARPGAWFWLALALGAALRVFFATATVGTTDAEIWTMHARRVVEVGLIGHYREDALFNHPPFVSHVMAGLYRASVALGVEFRDLYRPVLALLDMLSVWLLVRVLREQRWRFVAAAGYALAPVAFALSAMHGNTDAMIAACLLGACLFAGARRPVLAGVVLGFSAWIKLPGLLAAPAIGFALPRWRDRFLCAAVTVAVGSVTYWTTLAEAPAMLWDRVFGYGGLYIHTLSPQPTWIFGFKNWLIRELGQPRFNRNDEILNWPAAAVWWWKNSQNVAIGLMVLLAFLRRRENDARGVAVTIAGCYAIFHGLVETWTFQYLAWSMPFWFVAGLAFALATNAFAGGFIYALYALLCSDWLLRGKWAFVETRTWPGYLIVLRDLAHATFFLFAVGWLAVAAWREARSWTGGRRRA